MDPRVAIAGTNFPLHAPEHRSADPRLFSCSKLQRDWMWQGVRGAGRRGRAAPARARPCRSAATQPPALGRVWVYFTPVPVVRTACSGGRRKKDRRVGPTTGKESSVSVLIENCQNCEYGTECGGCDSCPHSAQLGGHNGGLTGPAYYVLWRLTSASVFNLHSRSIRRALLFFPLHR